MEVEVKFVVPDRDTMLRLQRVVRLGPFVPGEAVVQETVDRYLDTGQRTLRKGGYACRLRRRHGTRWLTIKGLGEVDTALHRRFESEQVLPAEATIDPQTWPEGEERDLVLSLLGSERLEELFVVEQVRQVRPLHLGDRLVAELSLDQVGIRAGGQHQDYRCLEAELTGEGEVSDLHALAEHLTATWGLEAEVRSKFELGLALLENAARRGVSVSDAPPVEGEDVVSDLAARQEPEPAAQLGAQDAPESASSVREAALDERAISVDEMCERFGIDMAHARHVAKVALLLFDRTEAIHHLGAERRRLLATMAMLHDVGLEVDPDRHHVGGRDIVLENRVEELTESEQRMLAAAVYLHRKRIRRRKLEAEVVVSLPPGLRRDTLVLAALVRMADGLDYSQSQSTSVEEVRLRPAAVQVVATGPLVEIDLPRAQTKADLWEVSFSDRPFTFAARGQELASVSQRSGTRAAAELPTSSQNVLVKQKASESPGILPDDPMTEAGRKVLAYHFARMLEHEPGTRAGLDIEELHDMRVATRRMRSAFGVFAPYYKARAIRPHVVGLRRTARALGRVRDLDVLLQKARGYLDGLGPEHAGDLDLLLDAWSSERERARRTMIDVLDSAKYRDFLDAFGLFLVTPGAGARQSKRIPPRPTLVRHVAPQLIYNRWASVQAFGPLLEGAHVTVLHALRIECKRLRYTLEFFREVLSPRAKEAIEAVIELQDHLGDLNDADVANALLSEFLFAPRSESEGERLIAPGIVAYLAHKQQELRSLIESFPQAWQVFNRPEIRHALADAVAVL